MTDIRPFRALRYNPTKVELSEVLAPVYDVVAAEDRARLWDSHPYAAVKLELTRDAAEEVTTDYSEVADRLAEWQAAGVLIHDEEPAIYVLRQRFKAPDGRDLARVGFFAALQVEPYEKRIVRPHERTLAGPKADRLKILRATGTNLSSVFMLYEDRDQKLEAVLEAALSGPDLVRATDTAGVINELAILRDAAAISEILAFMQERSVVIADGHHRYETALGFSESDGRPGSNRLLAYFANAFAAGSQLLPIHRLVREGKPPSDEAWAVLETMGWTMQEVASVPPAEMQDLLQKVLEPLAGQYAFAADDGSGKLRVFSKVAGKELSVRVIHREVLGGVFALDDAAIREGAVAFPKSTLQVARDLANGKGTVAIYLNPLTPDDVFAVTEAGEVLPQKSTYFAPKLPTGLLFRPLEADSEG